MNAIKEFGDVLKEGWQLRDLRGALRAWWLVATGKVAPEDRVTVLIPQAIRDNRQAAACLLRTLWVLLGQLRALEVGDSRDAGRGRAILDASDALALRLADKWRDRGANVGALEDRRAKA